MINNGTGMQNLSIYFADFETYMKESWYYKQHNDTTAFIVSVVQGLIKYDKKSKSWYYDKDSEDKRFAKILIETEGVVGAYINFFMSAKNVKKYKLGLHQVHYFHNGGGFDFYFIVPWLMENAKIRMSPNVPPEEIEANQLYYQVTWSNVFKLITCFMYRRDGENENGETIWRKYTLEFRDSMYIFKSSVKELGKEVQMKKGDTLKAIERANERKMSNKELKEDEELNKYVHNDSLIVAKFFELMCRFFPKSSVLPTTVASWAKAMFLTDKGKGEMKPTDAFRNYTMYLTPEVQEEYNEIFSVWYTGGLSTVQEQSLFRIRRNIMIEDVTSQYPDKMRKYKMPTGKFKKIDDIDDWKAYVKKNKKKLESGDFPCFVSWNYHQVKQNTKVPNILKNKGSVSDIENGVIMGYQSQIYEMTTRECYLYYIEFEKLIDYMSKDFIIAYVFEYGELIFTDYVDTYFNLKTIAKKEGKGAEKIFAKLMLNSLYGKFGEKGLRLVQLFPEIVDLMMEKQESNNHKGAKIYEVKGEKVVDGFGMLNVLKVTEVPMTYFQIASYITSLARWWLLKRWNEILSLGGEVYYCDTDSNFFWVPDDKKPLLNHGSKLGEWDLEHPKHSDKETYDYLFIQAPKSYITFHEGDIMDKNGCKGIKKEIMENCGVRHFLRNEPYIVKQKEILPHGIVLTDMEKYSVSPNTLAMVKQKIGSKYNLSYEEF